MTRQLLTTLTRRSVLSLLGAAPLAAGGAVALAGVADTPSAHAETHPGQTPAALLPGGAYDRFVRGLADQDRFSGTVLLAYHGKPVLIRSYQMSDKARGIPNRASTIFALASLTKFFTALAITQLVAQGKVRFDATLGSYLDGFPAAIADTVTVHHLLTHTSGIQDFSRLPNWRQLFQGFTTVTEAFNGTLALLRPLPPAFTAGTQYSYSNSNYFLLGAFVAQASGQPFWDYVPQHIFTSAGMTSTGFFTDQQWETDPRIARNYGPPQADGLRQDITPRVAGGPNGWDGAGGAFSSALDLLRFANALQDGTLLPVAWTEVMTSGKYPINQTQQNPDQASSQSTQIGYGTEERLTGGQRGYGHTGGLLVGVPGSTQPGGGSTSLTIYPDLDIVAVVLSNYFLYPGIGTFLTEQDRIITQNAS
ncbi:MAG: beta-lactamase family protein [Ktedonobacteraceae bacterium]|nr:beta-lactamase family protein [Ktedonobacteraceae bacterium]